MTPGQYLRRRRMAAGLTITDVAARLATTPRIAALARAEWIEGIELDVMPARHDTIVALRAAFPFDLDVLHRLSAIALGSVIPAPRLCRACACSTYDGCTTDGVMRCDWASPDPRDPDQRAVCTRCAPVHPPRSYRLPSSADQGFVDARTFHTAHAAPERTAS